MHDYLTKILEHKKIEVQGIHNRLEDEGDSLLARTYNHRIARESKKSFKKALAEKGASVIAEVKRKSPTKPHLAEIPDPVVLALRYVKGGAAAISVLTDNYGFDGSIHDLTHVVQALAKTAVPVLRKDFIIDPAQIAQSVVAGADAILLIVAILQDQTKSLLDLAKQFNIDALVEVHNHEELTYALDIGAEIIGVNNRNLTTFEVDVAHAKELIQYIPDTIIKVAESGINTKEIAKELTALGYDALLIGEALVTSDDPASFIKQIGE